MTPVEELLDEIRSVATDEHDKGDTFEQLMLHAFKTDRTFRQQLTDVWRWMEWPGRSGVDIGIDLAARVPLHPGDDHRDSWMFHVAPRWRFRRR
ncbi:MAG: hypothetical protein LC808_30920 [Actinobacteria bacterium]|nr:hypothetical protein [Actinomycetota bacterium]